MSLPEKQIYTEEDYRSLPEGERAELIDGELVALAAPSRIHQEILMELAGTIRDYIKSKNGPCKVYPAPFAVKLMEGEPTSSNRISASYAPLRSLRTVVVPARRIGSLKSCPRAASAMITSGS